VAEKAAAAAAEEKGVGSVVATMVTAMVAKKEVRVVATLVGEAVVQVATVGTMAQEAKVESWAVMVALEATTVVAAAVASVALMVETTVGVVMAGERKAPRAGHSNEILAE